MMKIIQLMRYAATVFGGCLCVFVMLTGCGIRDSAVVIPIGEEEVGTVTEKNTAQDSLSENGHVDTQQEIYIYVCGEVVNPGVYALPEDSRVNDALEAAGGFGENAAKEYVNLAAKVSDGEKLYFPTVAEAEILKAAEMQQGLVNINTASEAELVQLPGIGEARAQDIIAYRKKYGEFREPEDLMKVPGIKENMYAKLCDKIIVQ